MNDAPATVAREHRGDRFDRNSQAGTLPPAAAIEHLAQRTDSRHNSGERYTYSDLCTDVLLLHVEQLHAYIAQLGEHHAKPMGPAKTAEHFQLIRRAEALRQTFQPLKAR
ncbi:hypothetical protein [Pseudomonas nitroreducens]|uniref:hypothetical protein n=1 Tax=Pseudomonas nitroreducens TaxID=46680 RepID=UPI002658A9D2|nr:hypothetical protein [Pseudomonas nitroreducens]MCP1652703.1 hypothetical protein [Pseudomonas nitroreducens]